MAARSPADALRPVGGFMAMAMDTFRAIFEPPFQLREFLGQTLFIARVSIGPTIMLTIPFLGVVIFLINQLLAQIGGIDLAGAGVGLAVIREIGPVASVLIIAGAGGTAISADLGARTIRKEIDALRVIGLDPIHRLVVPRVLASTLVALVLNCFASVIAIATGYVLSVVVQGASPGQFVANLTLLTHFGDVVLSEVKAGLFGLAAGLVACYRGLTTAGGPKGVGDSVNQTVVLSVVLLSVLDVLLTAVYLQLAGQV